MNKNHLISLLVFATTALTFNVSAQDSPAYKPQHNEICYTVKEYKIECGNFNFNSTILSKKYKINDIGSDTAASFSLKTHPGDHAFLKKLAKNLGYIDANKNPQVHDSLFTWNSLNTDTRRKVLTQLSSVGSSEELKKNLFAYINVCLDYWSDPKATHDKRKDAPIIAEAAAMCIADSSILK